MIVERDRERPVPLAPKEEVAAAILDRVEALREGAARGKRLTGRGAPRPAAFPLTGPTLGSMADGAGDSLYSLYQKGMSLLEAGDFAPATVPLSKAARLAPEKSSIREALGRAYFRSHRYAEAAREFEAVVER